MEEIFDINITGPFNMVLVFLDYLLVNKKANIIIIGSATIHTGSCEVEHYSTTKVASKDFMKGFHRNSLAAG